MKKENSKPDRLFVKMYLDAVDSPAWLEMSLGARALFLELKKHYHRKRQGTVFLSIRQAEEKLGCSKSSVIRFFAELAHYGFVEKVREAKYGEGGRAPHYRLTDEAYLGKQPSKEYTFWDGVPYVSPVTPRVSGGKRKEVSGGKRKGNGKSPLKGKLEVSGGKRI